MSTLRRLSFLPLLVSGGLLLVFLFALSSIEAPRGMAAPPPPPPPGTVDLQKTMSPANPAPGSLVTFTVVISLGDQRSGLTVVDNLSGPGISSTSDYVAGSVTFDGGAVGPPALSTPNVNRRQAVFTLPSPLNPGVYTLTYQWRIASTIACNTNLSNGVNLRQAGIAPNVDTDVIGFTVKCGTTTTTTTPCTTTVTAIDTITVTKSIFTTITTTEIVTTTVTVPASLTPSGLALGVTAAQTTAPCSATTRTVSTTSTEITEITTTRTETKTVTQTTTAANTPT